VLDNAVHREPLLKALVGGWMHGKHTGLRDITGALADGTEDEKLAHVFWFNCLGTDQANGRFQLDDKGKLPLGYNYPSAGVAPGVHQA
jgi:hypothetical protein